MELTDKFVKKEEKELALKLFRTYSPSASESDISDIIKEELDKLKIEYYNDTNGNIFWFDNPGMPLLSSHMDQVSSDPDGGALIAFTNIIPYGTDEVIKGMGNIGGDDKCGIFLILLALRMNPKFNFVFSVEEESGGIKGIKSIDFKTLKDDENFKTIPYALILDRRNNGDIICSQNNYGTKQRFNSIAPFHQTKYCAKLRSEVRRAIVVVEQT
jgi:di/tripeptidase